MRQTPKAPLFFVCLFVSLRDLRKKKKTIWTVAQTNLYNLYKIFFFSISRRTTDHIKKKKEYQNVNSCLAKITTTKEGRKNKNKKDKGNRTAVLHQAPVPWLAAFFFLLLSAWPEKSCSNAHLATIAREHDNSFPFFFFFGREECFW